MSEPSRIAFFVIAGLLTVAYGSYIQGVVTGRIRPSRTTWLIYTCSNVIALAAALQLRELTQLFLISIFTLGASSILIASIVKKIRQPITWIDWLCGTLALLALCVKLFVSNQAALFCVVTVWLCAWVPQVRSCWRGGEDWRPSLIFTAVGILTCWVAVQQSESALVALTTLFQSGICLAISLWKRPTPWKTPPTP